MSLGGRGREAKDLMIQLTVREGHRDAGGNGCDTARLCSGSLMGVAAKDSVIFPTIHVSH